MSARSTHCRLAVHADLLSAIRLSHLVLLLLLLLLLLMLLGQMLWLLLLLLLVLLHMLRRLLIDILAVRVARRWVCRLVPSRGQHCACRLQVVNCHGLSF